MPEKVSHRVSIIVNNLKQSKQNIYNSRENNFSLAQFTASANIYTFNIALGASVWQMDTILFWM